MKATQHFRNLFLLLSGMIFVVLFAVVQAGQTGASPVYLPAVFGAEPGPLVTPTPTPTPESPHFSNCAFRTGNNATIAITVSAPITGDFTFEVDDEIAIFNTVGSLCVGTIPWDGKNVAITAWGDDTQTNDVDGLLSGEEMKFRIWDKSAGKELSVSEVSYSLGDGIYQTNGIYVVSSFTMPSP